MSIKCKCGKDGLELHTCPFKTEITNNQELCNCCENCKDECCQEI